MILASLRLVKINRDPKTNQIQTCSNLTILNLLLVLFGPMREDRVTTVMMGLQVICSALAFAIRYGLGAWFYEGEDRR
jgi:UDP-N-acetylglucosamine--dolichyl-phosphate N-acetylglucosaminephosphotransferase